jgi:hypothetical protein
MRKILLLLSICSSPFAWGQYVYHNENLPVNVENCSQGQFTATLYADWYAKVYLAPYYYSIPYPPSGLESTTAGGGVCAAPDQMTYDYRDTKFCHTWIDAYPTTPLNVTLRCNADNSGCIVYSVNSNYWLRVPGNDY